MSDRISFYLLKAAGACASVAGYRGRRRIGNMIGDLLRAASAKRRAVTLDNISHAFPELSRSELENVMKGSYRNLGLTLVELLVFPKMTDEEVHRLIRYKNIELLHEAKKQGKGMLLLSGHYGNWELLAYSAGLFTGIPVTIVVRSQSNELADRLLNRYRTQRNNKIVEMHKAARTIIQTLSGGNAVALLADQSATLDKDVFVDFFGRPAATYESPAALALRFRCPVIIGFAERERDGSYSVELREIYYDDLDNNAEGIRELTRRHVKILEDAIRKRPELWSWQHRRWKHKV